MKALLKLFSWRRCMLLSILVIAILIIFNFYGLYTNRFYFFKFDNYIFPLLTVIHFIFLYVLWFKIKEHEYTDPQMRNLEYAMYGIFLIYIFKIMDTGYILMSYSEYQDHIMPKTFVPIGATILLLQFFLLLLTILTFKHRMQLVGPYNFDNINENIDSWQ
ncbi:hypothetical protein [uncultured Eudoraea sp.]|uniref:hypothetical protein n=1 Tax=uncultured Eudoraea sp. TaxID=1035614 RepID=UPI0026347E92|nr:hypothetical protein [uncultured Eudoraea sp.]